MKVIFFLMISKKFDPTQRERERGRDLTIIEGKVWWIITNETKIARVQLCNYFMYVECRQKTSKRENKYLKYSTSFFI